MLVVSAKVGRCERGIVGKRDGGKEKSGEREKPEMEEGMEEVRFPTGHIPRA